MKTFEKMFQELGYEREPAGHVLLSSSYIRRLSGSDYERIYIYRTGVICKVVGHAGRELICSRLTDDEERAIIRMREEMETNKC